MLSEVTKYFFAGFMLVTALIESQKLLEFDILYTHYYKHIFI